MASYQGHLSFASMLAAGYGAVGIWYLNLDWGDACLAAGLVTVGGMLPDLDSDSGVPVREMFGISAAVGALLVYARLRHCFNHEQAIVIAAGIYLFIRYVVSRVFKKITVHRGMWHSLPAMCIAGLGLYLLLPGSDQIRRDYIAGAVMVGFLSHLVLDELYSINLNGFGVRLNQFAGSAVKFFSKSMVANAVCYGILAGLVWVAYKERDLLPMDVPPAIQKPRFRAPMWAPTPQSPTPPAETPAPRWNRPRFSTSFGERGASAP